jgi:hypothetical protein
VVTIMGCGIGDLSVEACMGSSSTRYLPSIKVIALFESYGKPLPAGNRARITFS